MSTIVPFDATDFARQGFEIKVDLTKTVRIPKPGFEPIQMVNSGNWIFPEDIQIIADKKHEYLYAFGTSHVWRTKDVESWELVR